ncbi:hypothetical protein L484_022307 [Morus notabilis]|uniref:Uncharacterized protein n=1 Tax=Morus notabilis TaxID=981085 RepID=W9QU22_9ROSA|nr:hypothetical protein L484_022307 [Morus notabilis]
MMSPMTSRDTKDRAWTLNGPGTNSDLRFATAYNCCVPRAMQEHTFEPSHQSALEWDKLVLCCRIADLA